MLGLVSDQIVCGTNMREERLFSCSGNSYCHTVAAPKYGTQAQYNRVELYTIISLCDVPTFTNQTAYSYWRLWAKIRKTKYTLLVSSPFWMLGSNFSPDQKQNGHSLGRDPKCTLGCSKMKWIGACCLGEGEGELVKLKSLTYGSSYIAQNIN
jgi:hypothetical protein